VNHYIQVEADATSIVERLQSGLRRHLLALKLSAPDRDSLEWDLASARALIDEYRTLLDEAMRQRGEFDRVNDVLIDILRRAPDIVRSTDAKERASAGHANSHKGTLKRIAREWFDRWCAQPDTHARKEEFIDCFLEAHPDGISARALREWLTLWSKEANVTPWKRP